MTFRLTMLLFSWCRRYPVSTHRQAARITIPSCKTAIKCDSDLLTLKCLDIKSPIGQHSCEGELSWPILVELVSAESRHWYPHF
ncbi:hypothetical protein CDAR_124361 [Caerostris darwini]|uniref:Secreted protein n=1 Tax=Caerostris darwini TaxID=1538125 RepID=A0AAV4RFY8_9ARAC|nr:hypothetical protein CDAR_124361 [Caerostris darwini]